MQLRLQMLLLVVLLPAEGKSLESPPATNRFFSSQYLSKPCQDEFNQDFELIQIRPPITTKQIAGF